MQAAKVITAGILYLVFIYLVQWYVQLPVVRIHAVTGECVEVIPTGDCNNIPEIHKEEIGLIWSTN